MRRAPGRTVLALIESTRVPVLVVAGRPRELKHTLVVSTPGAAETDFLRESARLARPLKLAATLIETGEERQMARGEDPFVARGIEVRTRERVTAPDPGSEATALLQFPSDLLTVPVIRRAPHQTNEIEPLVAALLASADRPVLVLPVERTETYTTTRSD